MPGGWAWCRLGEIVEVSSAKRVLQQDWKKSGIPFYRAREIAQLSNNEKVIDDLFITSQLYSELKLKYGVPIAGDLMVSAVGTIGKIYIVKDTDCFYYKDASVICFSKKGKNIDSLYLKFCCESDFLQEQMYSQSKGTTVDTITINKAQNYLIPLPPITEQKKIVDSIQKFFSHIDILEHNKSELKISIKQAKSKILDLAIHGKLVPQDPNDESAEELLKRIATSDNRPYKKFEDEVPFDLPDTWEWCNLDDIYNHTTGKALKKSNSTGTLHKYITTSNLYWNSFDFTEVRSMYFTDEELEKCTIKKGDLILCNGGDVGRAAIWNYDYDICYQNHVSRLRPKSVDINNYFYLYLLMLYKESGLLAGKGIGITSLSASDLLTTTLPLPPLAEQQRIVTKIEELFAQLDSVSEQLA